MISQHTYMIRPRRNIFFIYEASSWQFLSMWKMFCHTKIYKLYCTIHNHHNARVTEGMPLSNLWKIRLIPTMKAICIGRELIHVCIHTECTLTAMRIHSIYFHRWFEACWRWIASWHEIMRAFYIACDGLRDETNDEIKYNKHYVVAWLR